MEGTVLAPVGGPAPRGESEPSSAGLVFRFGVGLLELAGEGLASALRALAEIGPAAEGPSVPLLAARPANDVPIVPRHVLIGAIATTPRLLSAALSRALSVPESTRARRIAGRGRRFLGHLPGTGRVGRRWSALRGRAETQLASWAAAGRREEAAGRSLARMALGTFFEGAIARVAESPDLKRVIEEQSQGVTVAAVNELRERSRRADNLVEGFARRLLRPRASRSQ